MKTYYHRPNIGDVLSAIPVIQHCGGGVLYLDALDYYHEPFSKCLGFINKQHGIHSCKMWEGEPYDVSLEGYTVDPEMTARIRTNLIAAHFRGVGIEPPEGWSKPWLVAEPSPHRYPVVVHRSPRYRSELDFSFLKGVPSEDLFVVGYPDEAMPFVQEFGATWVETPTLDDLASVVASCDVFVGNQSSPVVVAAGLGKPRIMEECPWFPGFTFHEERHVLLTADDDQNLEALYRLGYKTPTG